MQQSYWSYVKQTFRQNRRAMISLYIIGLLGFVALFADFLANDKPIIAKYEGQWMSPILKSYMVDLGVSKWNKEFRHFKWHEKKYDFVIRPLIPYRPMQEDDANKSISPFGKQEVKSWRYRHWLGTATDGWDITSGMIHGTRVALKVGFIAMIIAAFIGILLGGLAGFFGDDRLKVGRGRVWMLSLFILLGMFYGFYIRRYELGDAIGVFPFLWELLISLFILIAISLVGWLLSRPLERIPFLKKRVSLPLDIVISRFIEIFNAIPALVFILAFVALLQKASIINIMVIIGLVSWTGIARFMRGELLRIRSLPYIEAASALGFSQWRILFRHAIPNGLSPVFISIAFGIAASILLEATLSFLNLSTTPSMESWGGILQLSRDAATREWWLAVFPGFAIFLSVTCFNLIGEGLTDALDPKRKKS